MKPISPETYRRATWVVGAIVVTVAVSGYFMGLRQTGSQLNPTQTISLAPPVAATPGVLASASVKRATGYTEQRRRLEGPNANWDNRLAQLVQPPVDYGQLTNVDDAERLLALRQRADRRAYDGAPPVVPHAIAQDSAAACLACHGPGLVVKDRVASKMSHAPYSNCTQCHVPAGGPRLLMDDPLLLAALAENHFVGLNAPLKGERAWPQAPPTIPHSTLMRTDCLSCHGPQGLFGLRTPHPERRSCQQCHVPGADLDQREFFPLASGFLPLGETTPATP